MKQRIAVMLGFKGFGSAVITIAGIELLHRIRKGQFSRNARFSAALSTPKIRLALARR